MRPHGDRVQPFRFADAQVVCHKTWLHRKIALADARARDALAKPRRLGGLVEGGSPTQSP